MDLGNRLLYYAYELQHPLAQPDRFWASALEQVHSSPYNPLSDTWFGKSVAAGTEIMARLTQNYAKPIFDLVLYFVARWRLSSAFDPLRKRRRPPPWP